MSPKSKENSYLFQKKFTPTTIFDIKELSGFALIFFKVVSVGEDSICLNDPFKDQSCRRFKIIMTTPSLSARSNSRLLPPLFVILLKYLDITAKLDKFKSSDSSF